MQNALRGGQKYCRMLQGEHSAILSTFIKLPFTIKTFVLSIFKWPFKTDFTVHANNRIPTSKFDKVVEECCTIMIMFFLLKCRIWTEV